MQHIEVDQGSFFYHIVRIYTFDGMMGWIPMSPYPTIKKASDYDDIGTSFIY